MRKTNLIFKPTLESSRQTRYATNVAYLRDCMRPCRSNEKDKARMQTRRFEQTEESRGRQGQMSMPARETEEDSKKQTRADSAVSSFISVPESGEGLRSLHTPSASVR